MGWGASQARRRSCTTQAAAAPPLSGEVPVPVLGPVPVLTVPVLPVLYGIPVLVVERQEQREREKSSTHDTTMTKALTLLFALGPAVEASTRWGLILDCGSSGTRVRLYNWDAAAVFDVREFVPAQKEDADKLEREPGISEFASDPSGAAPYIAALMAQAVRWVPSDLHASTSVRALATAGMRLLPPSAQLPIWAAVEAALLASPFAFRRGEAYTISGNHEALYGYLTVQSILQRGSGRRVDGGAGVLDLGGASTQITFAPRDGVILQDAYRTVLAGGNTTRLYAHSYMRGGQDQAKLRYATLLAERSGAAAASTPLASPCDNLGFNFTAAISPAPRLLYGTADYTACRALTEELLASPFCLLPPCAALTVYQPNVSGVTLLGISAFFYTANGLGLLGRDEAAYLTVDQLSHAGRAFCARPWAAVASRYATNYCFSSAYIPSLLERYGVRRDDAQAVKYARTLDGFNLGWTLGAQLYFSRAAACSLDADLDAPSDGSGDCVSSSALGRWTVLAALVSVAVGGVVARLATRLLTQRAARSRQLLPPSQLEVVLPQDRQPVYRAPGATR